MFSMDLLAPGLVTAREAADQLGLRVDSFRRQHGGRLMPAGRIGNTVIYRKSDVDKLDAERKANPNYRRRPFPLSVKYD